MNESNNTYYTVPEFPDPSTVAECIKKTLYDPCPLGFNVPEIDIFSNVEVISQIPNRGLHISTGIDGSKMIIPTLGLRDHADGTKVKNHSIKTLYWCADVQHQYYDRVFYFSVWHDGVRFEIEKWQFLPTIYGHWNFPHNADGLGVIPQLSKSVVSHHLPQILPGKDYTHQR